MSLMTTLKFYCMRITKPKPISQGEEIASLSRDHHDGLLLSWKINSGLRKGVSPYRIRLYVLYFFDNFLEPHFAEEEQLLYPLLDRNNPERREAELQHAGLRVRMEYFEAGYALTPDLLKDFADKLSEHIRFEENTLFNAIQQKADHRALRSVINRHKSILTIDNDWYDQFWLH